MHKLLPLSSLSLSLLISSLPPPPPLSPSLSLSLSPSLSLPLSLSLSLSPSLSLPLSLSLLSLSLSLSRSIQKSTQAHPGPVASIELSPINHNKLLIGYEKGIIVLWDVTQPLPERNFPNTMEEIKQVCNFEKERKVYDKHMHQWIQ